MMQLSLCTVTSPISLALVEDGECLVEINLRSAAVDALVSWVDRLLQDTGKTMEDIDSLVVVNGPGSYSGIRSSLAFVKTMALVRKIPVVMVNTLEMIAYSYRCYPGMIAVVLPARKNEGHLGLFGGGRNWNPLMSCEPLQLDLIWERLALIEGEFVLITDCLQKPDRLSAIDYPPKISATEAARLARGMESTKLAHVKPYYAYPVHITKARKRTHNVKTSH